jgi:TRAP-type C4-dicarboxylate transport system substrate-binding protein
MTDWDCRGSQERRHGMRKLLTYCLASALLITVCFHAGIATGKELKAVCFLPKHHPLAVMTLEWVKRINEYCQGELRINYLGGPEVIPPLEQVEALRRDVVQITFNPTAYYQSIFPEGAAFTLSKLTPWEERRPGGFHEFMVERHKRINAMYLGRCVHSPFYLWLKEPVKTPGELRGSRLRSTALYDRFMKALGAVPVTISVAGTYDALRQGVVVGTGWPLVGARYLRWTEFCKYVIDHPFYNQDTTILMNLATWNSLEKTLQNKIINLTAWYEPYMVGYFDSSIATEWNELAKTGVRRIRFSSPDAKIYLDRAYEAEWDALEEEVPDLIFKLRKVTQYW